jgi:hypothetical protein
VGSNPTATAKGYRRKFPEVATKVTAKPSLGLVGLIAWGSEGGFAAVRGRISRPGGLIDAGPGLSEALGAVPAHRRVL